jgi:hypothetical protein
MTEELGRIYLLYMDWSTRVIWTYDGTLASRPYLHTLFKIHFNISLPITPGSPNTYLRFMTRIVYTFARLILRCILTILSSSILSA